MSLTAPEDLFLLKISFFLGGETFTTKVLEPSLEFPYHREDSNDNIVNWAATRHLYKYTVPSRLSPKPKL